MLGTTYRQTPDHQEAQKLRGSKDSSNYFFAFHRSMEKFVLLFVPVALVERAQSVACLLASFIF